MVLFYRKHIYGVNYAGNNINQIEENPGLLIIFSLILSNPHLYEMTEYRCPTPTLKTI